MVVEVGDGMWGELDDFAGWALDAGLWNGRIVTWEEVWEERDAARERILKHLDGLEKASIAFQQFIFRLAYMGADNEGKKVIRREFEELRFQDGALIIDSGLKSSPKKFWKNHKKEIAIGAGVLALVTVVAVVAVCTGGTGASAAAAAGGAALDKLNKKVREDQTPSIDEGQLVASNAPTPPPPRKVKITGINGMSNSPKDFESNKAYLDSKTHGHKIDWVYNKSHGVLDPLEALFLNFQGFSPNTAHELEREWTEFYEMNRDDAQATCLHFCHSQGTIHTVNALKNCPQEVRNRVIVVAVAPATIVPREFCRRSYNYASKNDIVPLLEGMYQHIVHSGELYTDDILRTTFENTRSQLIVLEPHPEADRFDHSFQSPTYEKVFDDHINEYLGLEERAPK